SCRAICRLALEAADVVIDQLGRCGIVADHDEARWHLDLLLLPQLEGPGVVAIERIERGLQRHRQLVRVKRLALAATLLRHLLANVLPEVAIDWRLSL